MLWRRIHHFRFWCLVASALADLSRLRGDWRLRVGTWLYLSGFDSGEMVPRPARNGDRDGDHGIWWWCIHRFQSQPDPDGLLQVWHQHRGWPQLYCPRHHLLLLHDVWFVDRQSAAGKLAARWLSAAHELARIDHDRKCDRRLRLANATVLAALDCALLQRHCRHRNSRTGFANDSGNVSWESVGGGGR